MVTRDWRRRLPKFSISSSKTVKKETFQSFKKFIWMIFQKLKTCCNSISSFMTLIFFVDGELIGELCRRSIQKYENSVKLLRYNNHICYVSNINVLFKAFRCTTCDTFFSKAGNLEQHLVTCSDRVKHIYPKNVYELRETLFEKLDAFKIPYKNEQKLFKNLAIFDSESICVKEDSYKQTDTTTWIEKHFPISVSISSNLIPEPIFLCNAILIILSRLLLLLSEDWQLRAKLR